MGVGSGYGSNHDAIAYVVCRFANLGTDRLRLNNCARDVIDGLIRRGT